MKLKLFTLLLAVAASVGTMYASNTQVDGIWYNFDNSTKTASVTFRGNYSDSYSNEYSGSVVIPSSVTYQSVTYNVTSIGGSAFYKCTGLTSVTIGNSVTSIGSSAFSGCSGLTSVTIGNSVTSIGSSAFSGCSGLTSVTIPNSVTSIGGSAFSGCSSSLTSIIVESGNTVYDSRNNCNAIIETATNTLIAGCQSTIIPNSVTSIGEGAFEYCKSLTSVTIGNSVTSIGKAAFKNCSGLTSVTLNSNAIVSKNYSKDSNLKTIFGGQVTEYIIGDDVTSIGSEAFWGCSGLTSITIPNSVTSIGGSAFYKCTGLTSVTIGNSVTSIGNYAFYLCSGLTSVTIGNSVTSIGYQAFYGCSGLTSVTLNSNAIVSKNYSKDSNLKTIFGGQVTEYIIGDDVTSIGESAFSGCSGLTGELIIPNSVTSIGSSAFQNCSSLTSVTLNSNAIVSKNYSGNSNLKTIFGGQVTEYILGESVTSIGNAAFYGCSGLTSLTIPNSVTSIADKAFEGCSSLTSVTIPNSVTSIGSSAFEDCSGLTGELIIPNSITSIGNYAFYDCTSLTSVTIGNSVTSIGNYAFRNCSNITIVVWNAKNGPSYNFGSQVTSFTFGNEVEIIPAELCKGMTNLTSVIWNAKNCSNSGNFGKQVESFVLGDSVEVIPDDLCKDMSKLSKIEIPKSVVRIGNNAFKDCGNDGNLVLPASLKTIGDYAFKGWTKTKKIDIPNNVTKIGAHAFDSCYLATSVYLGSSVEEIGDYAFKGCVRVNEITSMNTNAPIAFENTLTSISANAYLYVPAGSKHAYQIDPYWSRFNVYEIAAEESSLTKDAVTVVANEDNAIFTWPTKTEAASYSLQISKDGEVFCTLVFNSNGQLTGIAFAPGRNGAAHAPAATMSVAGMSFTVTGLDGASKYAYRLAVTNDASEELVAYSGEFATTGYNGEVNPGGNPEGINDVQGDQVKSTKFLHNGQIYILRNGKTYTMQGQEVK